GGERDAGVAGGRHADAGQAERLRPGHRHAESARLEARGRVQSFVLHPEPPHTDFLRDVRKLGERGHPFTDRDALLAIEDGHRGVIAPHRALVADGGAWHRGKLDGKRLAAIGTDRGEAIARGGVGAGAATDQPGSPAICSEVAARTPWMLPNAVSSARRFTGPTPGIFNSSDVTVRIVRRLRLYVTAVRWASSRACCNSLSAGDLRGSRIGSGLPFTKISSSRLASEISGSAVSPSSVSASV